MEQFRVQNDTPGEAGCQIFEDYEWAEALSTFLGLMRYDRKVSLVHIGEEFEEE